MGYSTYLKGEIMVSPPLNKGEIEFLTAFNRTRHSQNKSSPYDVFAGKLELRRDASFRGVVKNSTCYEGMPGLWCHWIPSKDGSHIKWDGAEKTYDFSEWLSYLIVHFLGLEPKAYQYLNFLKGHALSGVVEAYGERHDDLWRIVVYDSIVSVQKGIIVYEQE